MITFLKINWPLELRKHTFKYTIVQLNQTLVEYLMADQIFISQLLKQNENLTLE